MSYAKWRIFKGFQLCCSYEVAPDVKAPSFVSVDQNTFDKQNIIITKGNVRIEFSCDTDIGTVTNIIGALLC